MRWIKGNNSNEFWDDELLIRAWRKQLKYSKERETTEISGSQSRESGTIGDELTKSSGKNALNEAIYSTTSQTEYQLQNIKSPLPLSPSRKVAVSTTRRKQGTPSISFSPTQIFNDEPNMMANRRSNAVSRQSKFTLSEGTSYKNTRNRSTDRKSYPSTTRRNVKEISGILNHLNDAWYNVGYWNAKLESIIEDK